MTLNATSIRHIVLIVLILPLLTASCTMRQDIQIDSDGGGRVTMDISLADYLTTVVEQIQSLVPAEEQRPADAPFFDLDAITEDFAGRDGVELERIASPDRNSLSGAFRFDDINALYQEIEEGSAESRLVNLNRSGEVNELTVRVTRETVQALLDENPSMNNPLVTSFGPTANEGLSEEDYLSMMEFALGEESRKGILESSLVLNVSVEGSVIDQKGGTVTGPSSVVYEIPLLPVLLLNENLQYSLRYR